MKIYFAGPLFTPYVRTFISQHANILRSNGIDVFVPHERFNSMITEEKVAQLVDDGLIPSEELKNFNPENIMALIRSGKISREQAGLPAMTPETIFLTDYEGLASSNAVLALLDGTQVDDGTACEIGIFYGSMKADPVNKKGIVGYTTDSRAVRLKQKGYGQNLFVLGVLEATGGVQDDFDDVIALLLKWKSELI